MLSPLFGYLDPGSGSILLYVLAGILVAFGFSVKKFFYRVLHLFSLQRGSEHFQGTLKADVLVHSEGPQYEPLFLPIVAELAKRGVDFIYVTQYQRAENSPELPDGVKHVVLSDKLSGFAVLNDAEAKVFLTTTPQLDVLMLKRSRKVRRYVNVLHAPTDIGTLEIFALDFFDAVLCPGEFMFEEIRRIESLRMLPAKKLYNTGVLYYDSMCRGVIKRNGECRGEELAAKEEKPAEKAGKKVVLIAPSWGPNGLFTRCGVDLLDRLATSYELIVRPHPQTKKSQKEIYEQIRDRCEKLSISLDEAPSGVASMNACDIMVSDFSGIVYDYAFLYEKPLVVFDMAIDYRGFEGYYLSQPIWRMRILPQLATVLKTDEIDQLDRAIETALKRSGAEIASVRDRYIPNMGHAAPVAVDQLLEILADANSAAAQQEGNV